MKTVTIFIKFNRVKVSLGVASLLKNFKNGTYAYIITRLRQLLKEGNKQGYDNLKKTLEAVTFCGQFLGGRKMQYLIDYTGIMVLDIDKLTHEQVAILREVIIRCEYTMACFVSPSGFGLKVLVQVGTGIEEHLSTFNSVVQYYENLTGVAIDRSGKDITRLCFVTYDPDLYYNPQASIYRPLQGAGQTWPVTVPVKPVLMEGEVKQVQPKKEGDPQVDSQQGSSTQDKTTALYLKCIKQAERYHTFVEGQRNEFVFALAGRLHKVGMPEDMALMLIRRDYNYNEYEVQQCVRSAYSYNGPGDAPVAGEKAKPTKPVENPAREDIVKPSVTHDNPSQKVPKGNPLEDPKQPAHNDETSDPSDSTANPPQFYAKGGKEQFDIKKVEAILSALYEFRRNLVTGMLEFKRKGKGHQFKRMEDHDENSIFRLLIHNKQKIPQGSLHSILNSDFCPSIHPFRNYYKGLKIWDGVTDYIGQLAATVRTTDDAHWLFCFTKWFVAYAMSLIVDAVINHTVIVFVGAQGIGKTSWMKLLLPKKLSNYVGTAMLHADSKDTSIQLSECALIILDEFESLNRKDLSIFKDIVTRSDINIRRPYGHFSENLTRHASFTAAVNHDKVLTDITGSRRYLCFTVLEIDYMHTVDLDGCMAQALALYKSGFQFWFNKVQISNLTEKNEDYISKSIVEELIVIWLRKVTREEYDNRRKFLSGNSIKTLSSTQIGVFLTEKAKFNLMDQINLQIGKIMEKLEFAYVKRSNIHYYILRIVDAEQVEREMNSGENPVDLRREQENNDQIIRFEEDLSDQSGDDELPF
jgi:hypothetical protein